MECSLVNCKAIYSSMGSEVSQDETLSPGQGSWIASGSVGEIRSGVQRAVSIVLVSECVPQVLLLAGGQLLRSAQ